MGNRATVTFHKTEDEPAVYLHWNGGPESVYAFLEEFKKRNYGHDEQYDTARFAQVVGEFFDPDALSLGILPSASDPGDNGIYYIANKQVVRRIVDGVEWSKAKVTRERNKAVKEQQYLDILSYFDALREHKKQFWKEQGRNA